MKIHLAKSSGFCFGVKRAINISRRTAKSQDNVYMLGNIVHNEDVIKEIAKTGIKKIKKLRKGKKRVLLIRAHGTGIKILAKAHRLGFKVVDATCPMVKEIHKIAQDMESKGFKIIVIGDKKHDEVQGIIGQLKRKALIIDGARGIPKQSLQKIKKAVVLAQSTQNNDEVLKIVKILKRHIKMIKFFNTICKPTRTKQQEIKKMPLQNELMIIIGSKTSANTKRLYQISRSLNKKSFWVQSGQELKPRWFKGIKTVGVAAGASTPDSTMKAVISQIRRLR
ncbi:MAG: 4-hydroxy-3-methylbut-2-enyl diphosphate reductase [Omnitrophica bacterium]|nr:4-hydroxy-3-methylbut-2-enyl diphosphate reductase [Candidatus Omnitrophota bacterium]